jgi:hypothetical protein
MRKGKGKKTRIFTSHKPKHAVAGEPGGRHEGKKAKGMKHLTKKVHRKHKGFGMKSILKGQMTYKKGRKR